MKIERSGDNGTWFEFHSVGCLIVVLVICGCVLAVAGTAALVRLLAGVG